MAHRGRERRAEVDMSSPWTAWTWNDRGAYWYSFRYGPDGKEEYDYLSAEQYQATQNLETTPRFPGPSALTTSAQYSPAATSTSTAHNTDPSSTSYTHNPPFTGYEGNTSITSTRYGEQDPSTFDTPGESSYNPFPTVSYGTQGQPATSVSYSTTGYGSRAQYSLDNASQAMGRLDLGSSPSPAFTATEAQQYSRQDSSNDPGPSTDTSEDPGLDPRYKVIEAKNVRTFWKVGRVFLALWTEPAREAKGVEQREGDGKYSVATHSQLTRTYLGGMAFSEIRRYVIIQEGYGNSICCPIHSYGGQATLKPNLPDATQHAIIYTSTNPPDEYYYDAEDGTRVSEELSKDPIKVKREQKGPEGDLGTGSRINYSKLYTIEHYNRVLNIGMVDPGWMETLTNNSLVRRDSAPERPRNRPSRGSKKSGRKDDEKDKGGSKKSGKEPERSERRQRHGGHA